MYTITLFCLLLPCANWNLISGLITRRVPCCFYDQMAINDQRICVFSGHSSLNLASFIAQLRPGETPRISNFLSHLDIIHRLADRPRKGNFQIELNGISELAFFSLAITRKDYFEIS